MGDLRKRVFGLCLILAAPALPICAGALPETGPVRLFATCTGRLSALMEYQWLMQAPGSDATEAARDQMAELLAAALPPGGEVAAMDLRLQAKVAEAALLSEAAFGPDRAQALTARLRAQTLVNDCTALLLAQARA